MTTPREMRRDIADACAALDAVLAALRRRGAVDGDLEWVDWPCATAGLLIQHYGKDGR